MACCAALAGLIAGFIAVKTYLSGKKYNTVQDPRTWFLAAPKDDNDR